MLYRVAVSVTTIRRTDIILFWYRYRYVTGVRVLCRRQCVSTGRPNATAMRLPPYVLHSRGFYRGKTPPPAPPTPSDRYVGRRRRSAGRRKSFGPGDAGAGARSHPPLECWPRARVRVRRANRVYTCACTGDLYALTLRAGRCVYTGRPVSQDAADIMFSKTAVNGFLKRHIFYRSRVYNTVL